MGNQTLGELLDMLESRDIIWGVNDGDEVLEKSPFGRLPQFSRDVKGDCLKEQDEADPLVVVVVDDVVLR